MDAEAFEAWLGPITSLTDTQRRDALQALAPFRGAEAAGVEPGERALPGLPCVG